MEFRFCTPSFGETLSESKPELSANAERLWASCKACAYKSYWTEYESKLLFVRQPSTISKQLLRDTEYIESHSRFETGFEPPSGVARCAGLLYFISVVSGWF